MGNLIIIIIIGILIMVILFSFYFMHRNNEVFELRMSILHYSPKREMNHELYGLLPPYKKMVFSFKKLTLETYVSNEKLEELYQKHKK